MSVEKLQVLHWPLSSSVEAVIQAFKVRNDKAGELSHRVCEKELYWQAEYWIMLMPVDIYRLAKHWEDALGAWKVIGVLFVYFMSVGNFSRVEFSLSV